METSASEGETGHDTSWINCRKRSRYGSPIVLNNRFSPLASDVNDNAAGASAQMITVTDNAIAGMSG